jgi:hypothetical protein
LKKSEWEVAMEVISLEEHIRLRTVLLLWTWWNVRNKADRGEGVRSGEEAAEWEGENGAKTY